MEAGIAKLLGMPEASMAMRQGNFAHLDGKGGLRNVSEQSRRIHRLYEKTTEPELRALVLQVLANAKVTTRT